jgi:membrane-associated phospholipid phosphatase
VVAGLVLMAWTLVAGAALHRYPGPNRLDHWGFAELGPSLHSTLLARITELGDLPALVVGSVLAALIVGGRDRARAVACLCGPVLAVILVDWLIKPLVGRRYLEVLTFPSGSVAAIAAVSSAWVVALPGWWRAVAVVVGSVLVAAMMVAVIALRWHYPSDALGGAAVGVGTVLLLDGLLHLSGPGRSR